MKSALPHRLSKSGTGVYLWLPRVCLAVVMIVGVYVLLTNTEEDRLVRQLSNGTGPARAMEIIRRFRHAEELVTRMRTVGKHELFTMTQCPANFSVGYRTTPGQLIPDYVGNTCEPWIARFALILLDRLLDADMRGLEWSTGSSTQWVLMRVKSLISIEHHAQWSQVVQNQMTRVFGADEIAKRWKLYSVDAAPGTQEKGPDKEDISKFRDYVAANFLPMGKGMFDYISVDGRARMHCLVRALPLLKPEGGILLLDNSERELYQKAFDMVPSWWLKFEDLVNTGEKTTIWVSCLPGKCGEFVPAGFAAQSSRRRHLRHALA